jgi:adenine phosphoribosyltransferase
VKSPLAESHSKLTRRRLPLEQALRREIHIVKDFPTRGIRYLNMHPIFERKPLLFRALIRKMAWPYRSNIPYAVVCAESSGFVFGVPIALRLKTKLVLVRKAGKLPGPTHQYSFTDGYGRETTLELRQNALKARSHVLIVDDVVSTAATAMAIANLIEVANCVAVAVSSFIEIPSLLGRENLDRRNIELNSILKIEID